MVVPLHSSYFYIHVSLPSSKLLAIRADFCVIVVFGATWLTVPWLYPTEIFPLECRARGNSWGKSPFQWAVYCAISADIPSIGVVGWSIGNGWLTLLTPVMFNAINEKTLYVFGACNILAIPFVWAFYPETNQRTLEEMDLLFSADSIFAWEAEKVRHQYCCVDCNSWIILTGVCTVASGTS
jgi:hypothetical protein